MAESSSKSEVTTENPAVSDDISKEETTPVKKQRKGILSRMWNGVFRARNEDFEKRLQHLSKEEASVLARMKRRAQSGRRVARNVIVLSVILEIVAVGYAIMTTRSFDLDWKIRALRVLPMFLLPGLSSVIYSTLVSFTRMRERKDQKTLERLRAERQMKIDELKERTNYYITQQLIQRYDSDPAAKAAAARVLASKLGADSGLEVYLGNDADLDSPFGKSKDVELAQSKGLRNRKHSHINSTSPQNLQFQNSVEEVPNNMDSYSSDSPTQNQVLVDNHPNPNIQDGGWFARIAALLVGEDPRQSYALICSNCHMHNGLARKEDFAFITYYCPHCHALNRSKQLEGNVSVSNSSNLSLPATPSSSDALSSGADIGGSNSTLTNIDSSPKADVDPSTIDSSPKADVEPTVGSVKEEKSAEEPAS